MENKRRTFLKTACLTGACLCGFSSLIRGEMVSDNPDVGTDSAKILIHEWISTLLLGLDENEDEATCRKIMKKCALVHYDQLNMNDLLTPYYGDIIKFCRFLENEWGWKIDYRESEGVLVADENKNHCVCPMVNLQKGVKSSVLCYCSEGFAELMFSRLLAKPVEAKVISSIHRGDASCKYEIKIS